jgi:hypothetical protein
MFIEKNCTFRFHKSIEVVFGTESEFEISFLGSEHLKLQPLSEFPKTELRRENSREGCNPKEFGGNYSVATGRRHALSGMRVVASPSIDGPMESMNPQAQS